MNGLEYLFIYDVIIFDKIYFFFCAPVIYIGLFFKLFTIL